MDHRTLLAICAITIAACEEAPVASRQDGTKDDSVNSALLNRIKMLEDILLSKPDEMAALKTELYAEMDDMRKQHAEEISDLKETFVEEISKLRSDFEIKISETREKMRNGESTVNAKFPIGKHTHYHDTDDRIRSESDVPDGDSEKQKDEKHRMAPHKYHQRQTHVFQGHKAEDGLRRPLPRIRRQQYHNVVAFFATLTNTQSHLGANQTIVFDHVVTNVGNAYDANQGVFQAPVAGIYAFSCTLIVDGNLNAWAEFILNRSRVTTMWFNGDENRGDTNSNSIILHLNQGDDVSIRNRASDKGFYGNHHSMMSGFLIAPDDSGNVVVG